MYFERQKSPRFKNHHKLYGTFCNYPSIMEYVQMDYKINQNLLTQGWNEIKFPFHNWSISFNFCEFLPFQIYMFSSNFLPFLSITSFSIPLPLTPFHLFPSLSSQSIFLIFSQNFLHNFYDHLTPPKYPKLNK